MWEMSDIHSSPQHSQHILTFPEKYNGSFLTLFGMVLIFSSASSQNASCLALFSASGLLYEENIAVYEVIINRFGWVVVFMN